jgi:hypothetical protein
VRGASPPHPSADHLFATVIWQQGGIVEANVVFNLQVEDGAVTAGSLDPVAAPGAHTLHSQRDSMTSTMTLSCHSLLNAILEFGNCGNNTKTKI